MYSVVISGSRSIEHLPAEAPTSIRKIIKDGAKILIGDAPGVDKLVQDFLHQSGYQDIVIYHAYQKPRNNIGNWKTKGNYTTYLDRDIYMHKDGRYGLCIWDGNSRGTKANIDRLPSKVIIV